MPSPSTVQPTTAANASREAPERVDSAPDMETQLALSRACDLLTQALCTRDAAYANLAENPEDALDADNTVRLARETESTVREIARGQRRGDARNVNTLLNTLNTAVANTRGEVEEHEGAVGGEAAKRSAHQAEVAAEKKQGAGKTTPPRRLPPARTRRPGADDDEPAPRSLPTARNRGENEANEGDPLARAAAARGVQRHSRGDDNAPDAYRVRRRGESQGVARARTAVRRTTYDVARTVGLLDDHGADTAQRLETGIAHAANDEERQYYERERGDAINRRLFGDTFIHQEFRNAARGLASLGFGGLSDTEIASRLIANGAMVDGYSNWGPLNAGANAQWSDTNVRRLDRNGDGQLTAQEIAYALRHGSQAVAEMQRYNQQQAAAQRRVAFDRELQTTLGTVNATNWDHLVSADGKRTFDRNRDGNISLDELKDALRRAGVTDFRQIGDGNNDITGAELTQVMQRLQRLERARLV